MTEKYKDILTVWLKPVPDVLENLWLRILCIYRANEEQAMPFGEESS